MALLSFNSADVPAEEKLAPIPVGWYKAMVVDSEVKPTSGGNGVRVNLQLKVIDGPYANRVIFDGINHTNPNETAQKIGRARISAYCVAMGVPAFQDTQQLHGIPVEIRVKIEKDSTGQYDDRNGVSAVRAIGSAGPAGNTTVAQPGHPAPSAPAGFNQRPAAAPSTLPRTMPTPPPPGGFNRGAVPPPPAGGFRPAQPQAQPQVQAQPQPQPQPQVQYSQADDVARMDQELSGLDPYAGVEDQEQYADGQPTGSVALQEQPPAEAPQEQSQVPRWKKPYQAK